MTSIMKYDTENEDLFNALEKNVYLLFMQVLVLCSFLVLLLKYKAIQKQNEVYNYFTIDIISHQRSSDLIKLQNYDMHELNFWDFITFGRDLLYTFYFVSIQTHQNSRKTIINSLKSYSFMLTLLLFIPIMMQHKRLKLIIDVFTMTVRNCSRIFLNMIGITIAFIFVGNLLFLEQPNFSGITSTGISIFSLMAGDSVLDMLLDFRGYSYVGFLYISAVIVFFVFFF